MALPLVSGNSSHSIEIEDMEAIYESFEDSLSERRAQTLKI